LFSVAPATRAAAAMVPPELMPAKIPSSDAIAWPHSNDSSSGHLEHFIDDLSYVRFSGKNPRDSLNLVSAG